MGGLWTSEMDEAVSSRVGAVPIADSVSTSTFTETRVLGCILDCEVSIRLQVGVLSLDASLISSFKSIL